MAASPSVTRKAVTNAWKEPFVGAQPILPIHLAICEAENRIWQVYVA